MPRGKNRQFAITGETYGYWIVIGDGPTGFWRCRCECGFEKDVTIVSLQRGTSRSCGCHGKDWCRTHGMEGSPTYSVWAQMIRRCHKPAAGGYSQYGARGISVCDRWRKDFSAFYADMGERPGLEWS